MTTILLAVQPHEVEVQESVNYVRSHLNRAVDPENALPFHELSFTPVEDDDGRVTLNAAHVVGARGTVEHRTGNGSGDDDGDDGDE